MHDIKADAETARRELGDAMRLEAFDEVALGNATVRLEAAVDSVRKAFIAAFAKVHGALDAKQRQELADLIERGPHVHPYRDAH